MSNQNRPCMREEILTPTRVIAEFMGGQYLHDFAPDYITFKGIEFADLKGNYSCYIQACYFHISWSWLMPVFNKILKVYNDNEEFIKWQKERGLYAAKFVIECALAPSPETGQMEIDDAFIKIADFINWYNEFLTTKQNIKS